MAKNMYVGSNQIARKINHAYVGVIDEYPAYSATTITVQEQLGAGNVKNYFTYNSFPFSTNGYYTMRADGGGGSRANYTLTAICDLNISFDYNISLSDSDGEQLVLRISVGSTKIRDYSSYSDSYSTGNNHWSGSMKAGEKFIFEAGGQGVDNKNGGISNIQITSSKQVMQLIGYSTATRTRKVRKAYIGVNGVARQFFSDVKKLSYGGYISKSLLVGREKIDATSTDNYAIFAGGRKSSGPVNTVEAYDTNLASVNVKQLPQTLMNMAAGSINNVAIFAGGEKERSVNDVIAYDSSLSQKTLTSLSARKSNCNAAKVGDYLLISCDYGSSTVDTYNSSLVKGTASDVGLKRDYPVGVSTGNYAIFAGGHEPLANNASGKDSVATDAYNQSLTKITIADLSVNHNNNAGTALNGYAILAGGNSSSAVIDRYNSSLTRDNLLSLSTARNQVCAATLGEYAIFAGGDSSASEKTVDIFDSSFTRTTISLQETRNNSNICTIGDYALIAGGYPRFSTVEYLKLTE